MKSNQWGPARLIFYGWISFQAVLMAGWYSDISELSWNFGGIKISTYAVILASAACISVFGAAKHWKGSNDANKPLLVMIALYLIYQCTLILPLSMGQASTMPLTSFVNPLAIRLQVLLIPFLYWFVLPSFRDVSLATKLLCYSSLVPLVVALSDFAKGIVKYTDNGELRLVWGGASLLYAFVLITNLRFYSHSRTNLFLAVPAAVGLIIANHRSAYIVTGVVTLMAAILPLRGSRRLAGTISLVAGAAILWIVLLNVPSLEESFVSRVSTSLDATDPNAVDRFSRWGLAWNFFLSNPINGSMLSNQYYAIHLRDDWPPHNFIFELLPTEGIVGTAFYLFLICWVGRVALSYRWDQTMWQMFLVLLFYVGFCLFNANFLGIGNFLEFAFPCSMIMFRREYLLSRRHEECPTLEQSV